MKTIYFDNAATTKPLKSVLDAYLYAADFLYANPSSPHDAGNAVFDAINNARKIIAEEINAEPNEIYFTSGGTEANNLAILGHTPKTKNKNIVMTKTEHPSVQKSIESLFDRGFGVLHLTPSLEKSVDYADLHDIITAETSLVSVIHTNNETGEINNINEIGHIIKLKNPKTLFHVDAVQSFCKQKIDVKKAGIDLLSVSSHKINGLKGTGVLFIKKGVNIKPLVYGGKQQNKIRPGTENTAGIYAFSKAIRKIEIDGQIPQIIIENLRNIKNSRINSFENSCNHIINCSFVGIKSETLLNTLSQKGVYISAGAACSTKDKSENVLLRMGYAKEIAQSSVRISIGCDNTTEEANRFNEIINLCLKDFT